ncbi:zinc dependent phospholipase C family protein [Paenibacillus glycanilyticus]|uniref:zinc dependent phospholipase C family protein n=1 Tax=Paenibacillus glycanilyticus TaxID=126569 RepID=UPI00203DE9F0|nr:zinc dependent phospholipase C family protein [Paenibacillus glycanilyticus]MCM3628992.1 zinc dependent phospholipase C family protein [Paenibacillus glycanilyticus]
MPNVWTHLIFGQKVLDHLQESGLISSESDRRLFNMGCQGPDFLFYHRFLPWQGKSPMLQLGTEMHNRECGPVIMKLLDSVLGRSADAEHPDPAIVYSLGFVLHHVLDRHMHPLVFSRSGFRKWDHQRYEVMMDTLVARRLWGIETWKTPVWRRIDVRERLPEAVVQAFQTITESFYSEFAPAIRREDWKEAIRDMIRAQRLFHDPAAIKRSVTFGQIEPFVFRKNVPYDVLNETGHPWIDPSDKTIIRNETAWTLWDRAMEDALVVIPAVLAYLRSGNDDSKLRESAAERIGNLSYETGLPCDSGAIIRYAEPVWPDGGIKEAP